MLIVSEELKTTINNKIFAMLEKIDEATGRYLIFPEITYDIPKKVTTAGTAWAFSNRINLNPVFLNHYKEEFINSTVIHEFAHLVVAAIFPNAKQAHGPEFRRVMTLLGGPTSTYHNFDSSIVAPYEAKSSRRKYRKFEYTCECNKKFVLTSIKHNKHVKSGGTHYHCRTCKTDLKFVKEVK